MRERERERNASTATKNNAIGSLLFPILSTSSRFFPSPIVRSFVRSIDQTCVTLELTRFLSFSGAKLIINHRRIVYHASFKIGRNLHAVNHCLRIDVFGMSPIRYSISETSFVRREFVSGWVN